MDVSEFKKKLDNRSIMLMDQDWIAANEWQRQINESPACEAIEWSWDCGLKLDYDGSLLTVSSRFYPPHKSHVDYGKYHGTVTVYFGEYKIDGHNNILEYEIEAKTLDELTNEVEEVVIKIKDLAKSLLFEAKDKFESILK